MGLQFLKVVQEGQIMEKSTKLQSNKCIKIACLVFGTIGLIWSALLLIICAVSIRYPVYAPFLMVYYREHCSQQKSDIRCVQLGFIMKSHHWLMVALIVILTVKFKSYIALLYGISKRKPDLIKFWLIIDAIEVFLLLLACSFELFVLGSSNLSISTLSLVVISLWLFFFIKIFLWNMFLRFYRSLLICSKNNTKSQSFYPRQQYGVINTGVANEQMEEGTYNRIIAHSLHHDDIEIEKANGKYM